MTKVVSTRLSETEHKKLLDKCNENVCTQADLLKDIVTNFLNGENPAPTEKVIEREDGTYILPAGSIMYSDGGVSCPDGSMLINFDDDDIKLLEEVSRIMGKDGEL